MPGLTRWRELYSLTASSKGMPAALVAVAWGRGPTIDMLPASTLNSCGSSSMLVLRMKRPTRVMRSSSRVVWRSALASVLSVYIERNLKTQISRLL